MGNGDDDIVSAACAILDRHDQGRQCGVPTVSVLAGPIALAVCSAQSWAEALGRQWVLIQLEQPDPESVVVPWVEELAANLDLVDAAVLWLAKRLDQPADRLSRSLRTMTSYEVGIFLESVLPLITETGVELVSRWLIEQAVAGARPGDPAIAPALNSLLEGRGPPWARVFRAMGELICQERLPVLVLALAGPDLSRLEWVARLLADLAVAQPRAALILVVESRLFGTYLAQPSMSRAKALLRESVVALARPLPSSTVGPGTTPSESREFLSWGSPVSASNRPRSEDQEAETWDLRSEDLGSRIAAVKPPEVVADDDAARSAAERFLFERLEAIPETAGLFELNRTLDFRFGPNRWIEVDLSAPSLKLVIEVDGYHHFQDPAAYRRDRRKDLELQKRGYLVARVLAGDVVERLEDVLATILTAVAFRRAAVNRH